METEAGIFAIGKYRVIGTLGRGAMGVVYKAQDPEIGRIVAVKVLRSLESESAQKLQAALDQFKIEARSAGNLRHPHIITVFEVSSHDASPYIVMDYIEGQGLDQLLARQGALAPDQALPILRQIAEGLDHAHERGVIHRDIKPSNILVDSHGTAFIVDFGVATIGRSQTPGGGSVVGSPGYMSPEQILAKKVDHLSDLFSFAILAFEVLAGVRPFDGDTFNKVISQILNNPPRSINTLRPAYPLDVEVIFERGLSKKPSARYQRAVEFVEELERAFSRSRPESRGGRSDSAAYQRKPSLWGSLDVDGSIKRANENNLPAVSNLLEGATPQVAKADDVEWKRPKRSAKGNNASRTMDVWGSSAFSSQGSRSVPAGTAREGGQSPELVSRISFDKDNSRLLRGVAILLALSLIATGVMVLWFFVGMNQSVTLGESLAVESQEGVDVAESVTVPAVTPVDLVVIPEALEQGRFDEPDLGHSIDSMKERELLGVMVRGNFPIDDLLKAMVLAEEKKITGRYEAAIYLLHNDSYVVRIETIKYLAASRERRFVPAILEALQDREALVRIAAANALRDMGDRKSISFLMAQLKAEQLPEVKGALRRAVEKLNGFPLSGNF